MHGLYDHYIQVPLGVFSKSEQVGHDMINIMMHIQKYVPRNSNGQFVPIFLVVTSLRGRELVEHVMQDYSPVIPRVV